MALHDIEIIRVPVTAIHIGPRKRPVDPQVVRELAQSIERQGLLQPIGIKPPLADAAGRDGAYELVFGAHRLEAYALLKQSEIEACLLPADLSGEEYLLLELQENLVRNDLTKGQRKAYAAEVGQLSAKIAEERQSAIGAEKWFDHVAQTTRTPKRTLLNWWHTFCATTNRSITPRQSLDQDREAFFTWLRAQQEHEATERARKEAEAHALQRRQDLDDTLEELYLLQRDYGRETVLTEVINVFLAHEEETHSQ
jgi:ParB/RepB/Spo0J family partition protein